MSNQTLQHFLKTNLQQLKEKGLYNEINSISGPNQPIITINHQEYINLSSNNYLGLSNHPKLIEATIEATQHYGAGAGAVRTINGTMSIHDALEKKLAEFKHTEAAIVFQSGFNCNMGAISAIMDKNDAILSDALNHASIIDGCRLSGATILRYNHNDMVDLETKAKEAIASGRYNKIMVITDGVFSMDGDLCKLPEIVAIAKKYDLITYVDDAHGSGVMGEGRGTVHHFNLSSDVDLQMGTLSKAVGVVGGYVAGTKELIDWLKVRARPFLFSTSMTPGSAAACLTSLDMIISDPSLCHELWDKANYFKQGLQDLGFDIGHSETPITPCIIGEETLTQEFSRRLFEKGVYAKSIVFPTVPLGTGRIRNMVTSAHSYEQLDQALLIYKQVKEELGL